MTVITKQIKLKTNPLQINVIRCQFGINNYFIHLKIRYYQG